MRRAARSGGMFVALFAASGVLGLGPVLGMFADSDATFVEHFADEDTLLPDMLASYLLLLGAGAFATFTHALGRAGGTSRTSLHLAGAGVSAGIALAAVAFATVPTSLWFASMFDDAGLQEGQAVLPQLGYVALMMGAMVPAAAFMIAAARAPGLLPRWLSIASYPVAALVTVTAVMFMPLFLFVAWVVAVAVTHREVPAPV